MRGDILVVDDEAGPRESLRIILKPDHDVRVVDGGREALREIERKQPDLVLLDLRMPDMDGTEVLTLVKSRYPDVAVAIITAYAAVESARLAVRYGALDYLTKPYSARDVERIVEKALSVRRRQHDAELMAGQLAKMAALLVGRAADLDPADRAGLAGALDSLQSVQTSLSEDLESVRGLSELGEMAASITHDINNLLTVILTSSQILLALLDPSPPPGHDMLDVTSQAARIARAAEDCSKIIRRVKDFVRLNVSFQPSIVDVNQIVASVVDLKRGTAVPPRGNVEFVLRRANVPLIPGDEVALRTVLLNLVENSLEALTEGGIIELGTAYRNGCVEVRVRDTGCGMAPEVLANATRAFYTTGKEGGTGLGLSTADRVVRRHRGVLGIESEPGKGTTVTMRLPTHPHMDLVDDSTPAAPLTRAGHATGTLIVADDNDAIRDLIISVLEAEGYTVLGASDGLQAWALFEQNSRRADPAPIMLVADHEMPGLLGRDLALRVKQADARIPVLIVSGYIPQGDKGPEDEMIPKPFDIRDLVRRVNGLMTRLPN